MSRDLSHGFRRNLAVVIGINAYQHGITPLSTAVADAVAVARTLREEHGYEVSLLIDQEATAAALRDKLHKVLPAYVTPQDRLLVYFAGHGIALQDDRGPAGYLIPYDAQPGGSGSYLPMREVHDALSALACRHFLLILDCCFAGAFRWSTTRDFTAPPEVVHRERYQRYIEDAAWQVLTSAGYDQPALDVLSLSDQRGEAGQHSPFAAALLAALQGAADTSPRDGLITATELYLYLRHRVEELTDEHEHRQTPGLWLLRRHDKGEYILQTPGVELDLPPAPPLDRASNPYRGLESYEEEHSHLFFGRAPMIADLARFVREHPLTVVTGPSGTGKSSLVKAGLMPRLRQEKWVLLGPLRPGEAPMSSLQHALGGQEMDAWLAGCASEKALLLVDQLEEILTLCQSAQERDLFLSELSRVLARNAGRLHVLVTLRSDFGPYFRETVLRDRWERSQFLIKPLTQDELRQAIEKPASERVLYFQPNDLVDRLINDVVQTPGALPLLSFTLSELYLSYLKAQRADRALTLQDYDQLGGVAGALTQRATEEYEALVKEDSAYEGTVKRVMLRMLAVQGGELARRRVPRWELRYGDSAEDTRVQKTLHRFAAARLLVTGQDDGGEPYVEPAHDILMRGWQKITRWDQEERQAVDLQRLLTPAAREWEDQRERDGFLWNNNPNILLLGQQLESKSGWLNELEARFVTRSLRRRKRNQRLLAVAALILLGLTAWASLASIRSAANAREALHQAGRALDNEREARKQADRARKNEQEAERQAGLAQEQASLARDQAARADRERVVADQQRARAELRLAELQEEQGRQYMIRLDPLRALPFLVEAYQNPEAQTRESLRLMLGTAMLPISGQLMRIPAHSGSVQHASLSPDGKLIASVSADHSAKLWDRRTGRLLATLRGHKGLVLAGAFSWDGSLFVTCSQDKTAKVWSVPDGKLVASLDRHEDTVTSAVFSPVGDRVLTTSRDKTTRIWDAATGEEQVVYRGHKGGIEIAAFSPDGSGVVSGDTEGAVWLWQSVDGKPLRSLTGHKGMIRAIQFSHDGQTLLTAGDDDTARLWNAQTGTQQQLLGGKGGHRGPVRSARFGPGSTRVLTTSEDATAKVWNAEDGKLIVTIPVGTEINSASFSPDGRLIALGDMESASVLDSVTGHRVAWLHGHTAQVTSAIFTPDGERILTGSYDGDLVLWDFRAAQQVLSFPERAERPGTVRFSPDGQRAVTANGNDEAHIWDARSGKLLVSLSGHEGTVKEAVFSPNGESVVTLGKDRTVRLWNGKTGVQLDVCQIFGGDISEAVFAPRGDRIALLVDKVGPMVLKLSSCSVVVQLKIEGSLTHRFRLGGAELVSLSRIGFRVTRLPNGIWWEAKSERGSMASATADPAGQVVAAMMDHTKVTVLGLDLKKRAEILDGHTGDVVLLRFSRDGQRLLEADDHGTARIWAARTGKLLVSLEGHRARLRSADFSPDGRWVATGSNDSTVKLWDSRNGKELVTLRSPCPAVGVEFNQAGDRLATQCPWGEVALWKLTLEARAPQLLRSAISRDVPFKLEDGRVVPSPRRPIHDPEERYVVHGPPTREQAERALQRLLQR